MKPKAVASSLKHLVAIRQPTMLWGPPGVGKSSIVRQTADALYGAAYCPAAKGDGKRPKIGGKDRKAAMNGAPYFIDLRLPLLDAVDLRGIPMEQNGTTQWLVPSFLPKSGEGILFLDELVQAMPIVQSAASQLILDRRIGDYTLPEGWAVVAAGNREGDRAATNRMPSHIANRFTHLNVEIDYNDWAEWADGANINPMVVAFLGFRPEMLHKFDPAQKAFPTPRSWEFVHKIVSNGVDDECMLEVITGTVGEAAAKEFVGFIRVFRELPDYDDIVAGPEKTPVPDNAAARYALSTMLSVRTDTKDMKAVFKYLARMPEEFAVLCVLTMTRKNRALCETATYIQWAAAHKDVLLNRA